MGSEWVTVVGAQWPWLILVAAVILGIPYAIKSAKALRDFLWSPFVAHVRGINPTDRERAEINAKIADLEQQVQFLVEQVAELRYRDRMYWAWVIEDQAYHRDVELMAVEKGWDLPRHRSFDDFYDEWVSKHPAPKSYRT
ncbi:hypothetical protein [Mycolicibacterium sp.]|uniref:hypothetical protein n=1 Tax=Mycolicibacterium sp. TaxID=2320850 RepID=UPI0037C69ACA